jgi:hypothetical protein
MQIINPNETERRGVRYIHVFGNEFFDINQYSQFPYALDLLAKLHETKHNYGGYTIRVDHEVQNMSISLCSFKDQFSRPKGREVTDTRAGLVGIAGTFCVMTPDIFREGIMESVRLQTVHHCLQLWMAFDWPIEYFRVVRVVLPPSIADDIEAEINS